MFDLVPIQNNLIGSFVLGLKERISRNLIENKSGRKVFQSVQLIFLTLKRLNIKYKKN